MFRWEGVYIVGTLVLWACMGLLVMGTGYLVVNAWWIRRSILRPPPRMDEVVSDPGPG